MLDFKTELDKLLNMEDEPLSEDGPPEALKHELAAGRELLELFNKKQTDLSMQVEEIYDLLKEFDDSELQELLREEKRRAGRLMSVVIGLCDTIEDFYACAEEGHDEELARQSLMMWRSAGKMLEECGITRIGGEAGRFDPEIHTAQAVTPSEYPREHVVRVLRSGYRYMGNLIRKAAVILSSGTEDFYGQNNWH